LLPEGIILSNLINILSINMLGEQPLLFNTFHYMALWYDFREIKFYCTNYISFMNINDNGDLLFLDLNIDRRHMFGTSVHCVTWPLWPWLHSTCSWIYIYIWNRCLSHMPEEEMYSIQHQVIIFTCDLRQLCEFLRIL
jgi:hypothetical protein